MIRINPDPHTGGYAYVPSRAVTAFFPVGVSPQPALRAFYDAGFADEQVEVFSGPEGADKLDAEGRRHGLWVRFMRRLEEVFTDDYDQFVKADGTLRSGGTVVAVFTLKDEAKKRRAVELLMANRGEDVNFWGPTACESFSVGPARVQGGTPAGELRALLELDTRAAGASADTYRRRAEQAAGAGLSDVAANLGRLAADADRQAADLQQLAAGL